MYEHVDILQLRRYTVRAYNLWNICLQKWLLV